MFQNEMIQSHHPPFSPGSTGKFYVTALHCTFPRSCKDNKVSCKQRCGAGAVEPPYSAGAGAEILVKKRLRLGKNSKLLILFIVSTRQKLVLSDKVHKEQRNPP